MIFFLTYYRDAGMVILPAYYAATLNTDSEQVVQYYIDICKMSPVCSHGSQHYIFNLAHEGIDSLATLQFPCQCGRSRHVFRSDKRNHEAISKLMWCQIDVSFNIRNQFSLSTFSDACTDVARALEN